MPLRSPGPMFSAFSFVYAALMMMMIDDDDDDDDDAVREHDLEALAENAQYDLFHNSCSTDHCLNHLYTTNRKPAGSMQLRHRGHSFALPTIHLEFNKRHFVACVLFDYV